MEQRVRLVEERMKDHTELFSDIREGLRQFEVRVGGRFGQVDATLTGLRQDMTTHFRWTVGILVTCLASMGAIVAALLSR